MTFLKLRTRQTFSFCSGCGRPLGTEPFAPIFYCKLKLLFISHVANHRVRAVVCAGVLDHGLFGHFIKRDLVTERLFDLVVLFDNEGDHFIKASRYRFYLDELMRPIRLSLCATTQRPDMCQALVTPTAQKHDFV